MLSLIATLQTLGFNLKNRLSNEERAQPPSNTASWSASSPSSSSSRSAPWAANSDGFFDTDNAHPATTACLMLLSSRQSGSGPHIGTAPPQVATANTRH
jgi:hypothetical protein